MRSAFFIIPFFACLFLSTVSLADIPAPPRTYKKLSADGRFVFVMIPPIPLEKELKEWSKDRQKILKTIRSTYTKSGLYKNDGSKTPLWTVDWCAPAVEVAADGVHLVRYEGWGSAFLQHPEKKNVTEKDLKLPAVAFFTNGKMLRQCSISEFVDKPKLLPRSDYFFGWLKQARFAGGNNQFEMITYDQNRIIVDLTTAEIVEKKKAE